jgi:hypothetical protein
MFILNVSLKRLQSSNSKEVNVNYLDRQRNASVTVVRDDRAPTSREMVADVAQGAHHTGTEVAVSAEALVRTGRTEVQQRDGFTVLEQVPGCFGHRTTRRVVVDRYCSIKIK